MGKNDSSPVTVICSRCGGYRVIRRDTFYRITGGKQRNLCRSCCKRVDGGLSVAAKETVKVTCPQCGKERAVTGYNLIKISKGEITGRCKSCAFTGRPRAGHPNSEETRKILRQPRPKQRGDGNHRWKGGISGWRNLLRGTAQYGQWRRLIFVRDGFRCQMCKDVGSELEAHHIVYLSLLLEENHITCVDDAITRQSLWDTENGVTLCVDCHKIVHKSEGFRCHS